MREAHARELASWNRSGARSPRTFVPDPREGMLDARDACALDVALPLPRPDHDVHELVGVEEGMAVRLTLVDRMAVRRVTVVNGLTVRPVTVRRVPSGAVHGVRRSIHAYWSHRPAGRGPFLLPQRHEQPRVQSEEDHHRAGDEPYRAERRHET